jgi:hypothetical protein
MVRKQLALLCALSLMTAACLFGVHVRAQSSTTENFESGTKTSYAAADVFLTTGWWFFNDALIGNLSTDRKTGAASARVRNTGSITMDFDVAGASTVTVQHAVFGTDGSSSWELWASTNSGAATPRSAAPSVRLLRH